MYIADKLSQLQAVSLSMPAKRKTDKSKTDKSRTDKSKTDKGKPTLSIDKPKSKIILKKSSHVYCLYTKGTGKDRRILGVYYRETKLSKLTDPKKEFSDKVENLKSEKYKAHETNRNGTLFLSKDGEYNMAEATVQGCWLKKTKIGGDYYLQTIKPRIYLFGDASEMEMKKEKKLLNNYAECKGAESFMDDYILDLGI